MDESTDMTREGTRAFSGDDLPSRRTTRFVVALIVAGVGLVVVGLALFVLAMRR